jgi:copper chaperone CopZ
MKKYIIGVLSLTVAVTVLLTNCTQNKAQATVIDLPTMQCESCAQTITEAAESVNGVQTVSVSVEKKQATIEYAPSATDVQKIEKAIASSGYQANEIKANSQAYESLPDCCKIPKDGEKTEHVM